jgi:hypothetical protein
MKLQNNLFLILLLCLFSSTSIAKSSVNQTDSDISNTLKKFIVAIKTNNEIGNYFNEKVKFVYAEYNRCTGNTDGVALNILSSDLDGVVGIDVFSTGKGWACKTKKERRYRLKFDYHNSIKESFESISEYFDKDKLILNVEGNYPEVWFTFSFKKINKKYMIYEMSFNHEDPG